MRELSVPPNGNLNNSAIESALATLQPLRDLSRNWDIDIAACLEEYLHDLVGESPGEDQRQNTENQEEKTNDQSTASTGNGLTLNFAQAAIILQNSSHVYSRKVEYLHSLVYKALYEFFKTTSSNGNNKESSRTRSTDQQIEEFYDYDPHVEFLPLDDIVPEDESGKKINLKEDDEVEDYFSRRGSSGTPNQSILTTNGTRFSLGGLSVTRLDRTSLGSGGSSRNIFASAQDRALLGNLNSGRLRLIDGHCDVGSNGILLMPGSSPASDPVIDDMSLGQRNLFAGDDTSLGAPNTPIDQSQNEMGGGTENDYDDDNDDGFGFEMHGQDDPVDHVAAQPIGTTDFASLDLQRHERPKRVTFQQLPGKKKRADPWAVLDPHSGDDQSNKPLRKGKTYRLPVGVDLPPSDCVTGASTRRISSKRETVATPSQEASLTIKMFRSYLQDQREPPTVPITGLVFGNEFAYIARETAKRRAAARRDENQKQQSEKDQHNTGGGAPEAVLDEDDFDDDYGGGGIDFGGEADYGDNDDFGNTGVSSLDDVYQNENVAREDEPESNLGKTFEELCRAHIQAFAKGAEDFEFSTRLSDRVGKWQAKLEPLLEEEERRAVFDIYVYSEQLIHAAQERLNRSKRKIDGTIEPACGSVDFSSVTEDCTTSDVCRYFLASLSLANAGNLKIEEGGATFRFDLLSSDVERPMETFRAPSLLNEA